MAAAIPILFADDALVVVDKPAGMLAVEAPGRRGTTVVDAVGAQLGQRVHAVHRLDEETSGVFVLAKTLAAKAWLEAVFMEHRATRTYLALVSHAPNPPAGRIESRLRELPSGIVQSVVRTAGEPAVTDYRTLVRRERATLVECTPRTGRRNQLRVHLADLGSPICGDRKYGWRARGRASYPRVMLHAERIVLPRSDGAADLEVAVEAPESSLRR